MPFHLQKFNCRTNSGFFRKKQSFSKINCAWMNSFNINWSFCNLCSLALFLREKIFGSCRERDSTFAWKCLKVLLVWNWWYSLKWDTRGKRAWRPDQLKHTALGSISCGVFCRRSKNKRKSSTMEFLSIPRTKWVGCSPVKPLLFFVRKLTHPDSSHLEWFVGLCQFYQTDSKL